MEKYAKALEGISYTEWIKLEQVIDRIFAEKRRKMSDKIHLSSEDNTLEAIRSQFGRV